MSKSKYWRVIGFAAHYWLLSPYLFGGIVFARIASTLVDVSVPLASGRLVDAVAGGVRSNPGPVLAALAVFVGLGALFQSSRQVVTFLLNRMSARAITSLGRDAFAKIQRLSADWHANTFAGATVRKITRGMGAFDDFTDVLVFNIGPALIAITGVTAVFFWRWPLLGSVIAVCVLLFLASTISLSLGWIAPAARDAREWDSLMSATIADSISSNQVVKSFAAEAREDGRFAGVAENWRWRAIRSWDRGAISGLLQQGLLLVLQGAMLGTGVYLWTSGRATPGDIASLVATQVLISGYLRDIAQNVRNVQRSVNDMEDVIEISEMVPEVADRPGARPLVVDRGRITFDHITFKYKAARDALYENFSIELPAGQRVGLVGQSGAGKTTFVKLIQRLYDLDAGRILIDGQDIAGVTLDSLREAVGLVPQDPLLFHRSLAENIAYGKPGAPIEQITEAARLAHADKFIDNLPLGYETLVGERGVKLSGGERQRVAIARAILAATPVLILDEATSSLDSVSELYIREAIERLSSGRTTIVVAHRLSTVQHLDRILVFEHGHIVEDGNHAELMRRPHGIYRRLVETQSSTLIADAAE